MNVDTDRLLQIRAYRAAHDPLIPHPRTEGWLESLPEQFEESVYEARVDRIEDAPTEHPIEKGTWAEATVFCFTRSMDAAVDQQELLGVYQHCMDKFTTEHLGSSFPDLVPDSMDIITTDRHRERAEEFREFIATVQHKQFTEQMYDDLPFDPNGVPKAFWKQSLPTQANNKESNEAAQVTLTDY